ncbi:MAG TPA: glycosyltransferase family 2 protein [Candidatus Nanoarchaeia archaeon]|nr:glycosyltransferase family 2 protein [Candidatus Nanoarchaeia archaeon]
MDQQYELSVILPVYNEAKSIQKVITEVYEKVLNNFSGPAELVVAEDGSTDGTKEILSQLQAEKGFRLVSGKDRKGYNRALKDALALAQGKYVFLCDTGGAHEMGDFMKLYAHIKDNGVVSGFKKERGDPMHRIVLSRIYNLYVSLLFGHRFYDIDSGFKLYQKKILDQILSEVNVLKECISTEILLRIHRKGHKITEVPVIHYKRNFDGPAKTFSYKKIPKIVSQLFLDLWKLRVRI